MLSQCILNGRLLYSLPLPPGFCSTYQCPSSCAVQSSLGSRRVQMGETVTAHPGLSSNPIPIPQEPANFGILWWRFLGFMNLCGIILILSVTGRGRQFNKSVRVHVSDSPPPPKKNQMLVPCAPHWDSSLLHVRVKPTCRAVLSRKSARPNGRDSHRASWVFIKPNFNPPRVRYFRHCDDNFSDLWICRGSF